MHSNQQEQHDNDEPEQRGVDPQQQHVVNQQQTDRFQEHDINATQDVGEQEEVDVVVIGGGLAGGGTY